MIDFIQNETKKVMFNCCEKYAAKNKLNVEQVQLVLGLNEEGNTYTLCQSYVKKDSYDIMQVLGVRIDFLGYSKLAPPFILKSLVRYSEEYEIPLDKVSIMCVPTPYYHKNKLKKDVSLFLYNGDNYVPTYHLINEGEANEEELEGISFQQLFREEDFEMPT